MVRRLEERSEAHALEPPRKTESANRVQHLVASNLSGTSHPGKQSVLRGPDASTATARLHSLDLGTALGIADAQLLVGCYIAVCVPLHFGLSVISPVIALPLPEDQQRWYISNPSMAAYETLQIVGTALQLYHNAQTRTFAGGYALAAQLSALKALLDMVWHIPSIVGVYDAHPGVPVHEVINLGMIAVAAWQSRLYPRVEQDVKGDEVEEL